MSDLLTELFAQDPTLAGELKDYRVSRAEPVENWITIAEAATLAKQAGKPLLPQSIKKLCQRGNSAVKAEKRPVVGVNREVWYVEENSFRSYLDDLTPDMLGKRGGHRNGSGIPLGTKLPRRKPGQ